MFTISVMCEFQKFLVSRKGMVAKEPTQSSFLVCLIVIALKETLFMRCFENGFQT